MKLLLILMIVAYQNTQCKGVEKTFNGTGKIYHEYCIFRKNSCY